MPADAFFEQDGDRYIPSDEARGPWLRDSLHGRVVAAQLARTVEQTHGDEAMHPARLTVDLFRMPPFAPLEVTTDLVRDGKRIRVVDGSVTSGEVEIARGSVVMLRRADQPEGNVWSPPSWDVPSPEEIEPPALRGSRLPMWEMRPISGSMMGGEVEQKRTWLRETRALVDGEELTPFVRAAIACDFTNPFVNSGDSGLNFVNADVTLYLHRLPASDWLGFEAASHHSADGIAVGESTVYDLDGPIGRSAVCSVANEHRR
jgi:acyl-CoA thioesterase